MLFQSPQFLIFFLLFFPAYWALKNSLRLQNLLTLAASYVFYGWWDWRLLGLIGLTSGFDYVAALQIDQSGNERIRRAWLRSSLCFNLTILGFFKYYNFFAAELQQLMHSVGIVGVDLRLNILLPVGISFYTFQTLSYTVDVFRRQMSAARDPVAFFAYIAFFPQLVAGPIERAQHLVPQFTAKRHFEYSSAVASARLVLWGFFKKLAVADACAPFVDRCFQADAQVSGWLLMAASVAFVFQIYGDFSGYSDIARGTAGLLGINLMQNFRFPYFSESPAEFWRRWHISLSSWFRDYVYIPLGGGRQGKRRASLNVLLVFGLSGLWHGAAWTYVVWGLLNGVLVLITNERRNTEDDDHAIWPAPTRVLRMLGTFVLITGGWLFFRAHSVEHALTCVRAMLSDVVQHPGGGLPVLRGLALRESWPWLVLLMVVPEWFAFSRGLKMDVLPRGVRWGVYVGLCSLIAWTAFCRPASEFLYFQF